MSRLGELLSELEADWRACGWPGEPALGSPLERDVIRAALVGVGLRPAEELLDWFSWHNGPATNLVVPIGPVGSYAMSLDESLLRRQEELDRAEAWASEWTASPDSDEFGRYSADPENGWSRSWLPLLAGGGAWYHAVTVPTSGPVLMFIWEASDPIPPDDREMYPLETVIDSWVKAMPDAEWDPSIKGWRYLQESVPKPLLQY